MVERDKEKGETEKNCDGDARPVGKKGKEERLSGGLVWVVVVGVARVRNTHTPPRCILRGPVSNSITHTSKRRFCFSSKK